MVSKGNNMARRHKYTTQLHSVRGWVGILWLSYYMRSPRIEHFAFDL